MGLLVIDLIKVPMMAIMQGEMEMEDLVGGMMGMMGTIMMARLSHLHRQCPKPIRRRIRRRRQAVMEEGEVMTLTKIPMTVMKSLFDV